MIIDLHVHTRRYSGCSNIDPMDALASAKSAGLDGLALTEHGILWPPDPLKALRREAEKMELVLLAGQEITCFVSSHRADFLVFGLDESLGSSTGPAELVEHVHKRNGVVIAAHPFKPSRTGDGYNGAGEDIYHLDLDGIEYFHPDHDREARARVGKAADSLDLPMTGSSDAHEPGRIGIYATRFERPVLTETDLVREIKAGRIVPYANV